MKTPFFLFADLLARWRSPALYENAQERATPEHLRQAGFSAAHAQNETPGTQATGLVALAFGRMSESELLAASAEFRALGGQSVPAGTLPPEDMTPELRDMINQPGVGLLTMRFDDLTRLTEIDAAAANGSWGRALQSASVRITLVPKAGQQAGIAP